MIRGSTGHEATFVCTKRHWKGHKFAQTRVGEGASMIDGSYLNHLDIRKVIICFSHGNNTYKGEKLLEAPTLLWRIILASGRNVSFSWIRISHHECLFFTYCTKKLQTYLGDRNTYIQWTSYVLYLGPKTCDPSH